MTEWTKPSQYGCTTRRVSDYALAAWEGGSWSVLDDDTGEPVESGTAPDLASAQAAADAACEKLLREALADFGLVFVRTTGDPDYPNSLVALSHDGVLLYIVDRTSVLYQFGTIDPFRGDLVGWYVGKFATESEAIAAARAHDEQRRGGR